MEKTQLLFGSEVHEKILDGVRKISDAVTSTLGPKGKNVLLERLYGEPIIVHDGVTVAEKVELEDDLENQAAKLIKQAAQKTNRETGDGTTTVTLLAAEMVKEGIKQVSAGANGILLRRGMEIALQESIDNLKKITSPIKKEEWMDIATISAQDAVIGEKISEAFDKVGENGSIQVEEGAKEKIEITHQDGMAIDKGYLSRHFSTNYDTMQCILNDVMVLVTDKAINSRDDIAAVAGAYSKLKKPIFIIADSISSEILLILIQNKLGGLPIVAVQAPEFGDRRRQTLEDIALATGAKFISSELGHDLKKLTVEDFGVAKKIVADNYTTLIIAGENKDAIADRITFLKSQLEKEENEFEQEFIRKRIAKLSTGVAVIYAGGKTDVENREIRERINDAVGATRSAIQEGVVTGGAVALYNLSDMLDNKLKLEEDILSGYKIVKNSMQKLMFKLLQNCGQEPGKIINQIEDKNKDSEIYIYGYNAYTDKIENLRDNKIIDPSKVIRVALENSVSIAGSLITTGCMVVGIKPKKE